MRRIPEVGDVWLDAGIVPFSTLGWENPEWIENGLRHRRLGRPLRRRPPDHAYWETWFPADWVSEMREQIRLWFYSQLFMSVASRGPGAVPQPCSATRRCSTSAARRCTVRGGTRSMRREAFARMGADVMRWQFCAQPPDRNLLFGYGPAAEIKKEAPHALELGALPRRLREHREASRPPTPTSTPPLGEEGSRPLDRWLVARTQAYVAEATQALEDQLTHRLIESFDAFVDDVSNWYIRRSRRRFWDGDEAALRVLWHALVQGLRGIAR